MLTVGLAAVWSGCLQALKRILVSGTNVSPVESFCHDGAASCAKRRIKRSDPGQAGLTSQGWRGARGELPYPLQVSATSWGSTTPDGPRIAKVTEESRSVGFGLTCRVVAPASIAISASDAAG